jgi:hypothetical protein
MTAASDVRRRTAYTILFLVALIFVISAAARFGDQLGLGGGRAPAAAAPERQFTEADMDAAFLLRLQDRLVAAQTQRAREALREAGYSDDLPSPQVSSTYVTSNGHRYGLVRSRIRKDDAEVEAVLVVGLAEGRLQRVICTSTHGEVPLSSGPCAHKLGETFGAVL